jgi:hypothetical protein
MNTKEMRSKLRKDGIKPPQKNEVMIELYNKTYGETEVEATVTNLPMTNQYTYIGSGATPPQLINFMGMQVFMRGELTTVTNPTVLNKIQGNPCFVQGEYPKEKLLENDKEALKREQKIKEEHTKMEIEIQRRNRKNA